MQLNLPTLICSPLARNYIKQILVNILLLNDLEWVICLKANFFSFDY